MNRLLIIGSLNMDFLIETEKVPVKGETILGENCSWVPGGKGANQSFAAGKLGGTVAMIGAIGTDEYGRELKKNLNAAGVNLEGVEELEDFGTGKAFVMLEGSGENRIIVIPGANHAVLPQMIDRHERLMDECDAVVLQMEIPIETVLYAARRAKEKGKRVILDPSPVPPHFPNELFENVDVMKPNETELEYLSGMKCGREEELQKAAQCLIQKGVKTVVATRGSKGAYVASGNYREFFPASKVQVVDTTAAGDGFVSAFSLVFSGDNFAEAVKFANKVAEKVVQKKGAQTSMPERNEMLEFMPQMTAAGGSTL